MKDFNYRKCPLCGNQEPSLISLVYSYSTISRLRCGLCGLIYFDRTDYPKPSYEVDYNLHFTRPTDIKKAGVMACLLGQMAAQNSFYPRILEVGPANGLTSFLLKEQGLNVEISDISAENAFRLSSKFGLRAHSGPFESSDFASNYSLIYAGHTIEHIEAPLGFFKKAFDLLEPGGLFFFDTPDAHYSKKWGHSWKHFATRHPFEHCSIMEVRTINKVADLLGFSVKNLVTLPSFQSMQVTLEKVKNGNCFSR